MHCSRLDRFAVTLSCSSIPLGSGNENVAIATSVQLFISQLTVVISNLTFQ